MLGEYVYLTNETCPPVCCYYKDKKLLKSEEVSDIITHSKGILKQLKIKDKNIKDIESLSKDLIEIVIDETGIVFYTLKP